ncbi:hypothetical protein F5148DRAFT_403250 [Russula earlei]|uniref:Uncharacterized protein n=1 Tax=Russula earlei TaxID=71964 RepID=A0ACC0UHX0_9AGAM|nr:hypothetical protein F5148DRAFT_403250 [Russula earlei]
MATTVENGAEALKSGTPMEDQQSTVSDVQSQIDLLSDLCKRLQTLRQLPSGVLRSELVSGPNQVLPTLTLKDIFGKSAEDLRTFHAAAIEGKVQDALRAAAESERRDATEIKDACEREGQKRRRSPTPESPRPYLPLQQKGASPFPPLPAGALPLTLDDLPTYIREFNSTHAKKVLLHIYLTPGPESRGVAVPLVLRVLIPNVLRAFITLAHEEGVAGAGSETPALMVESLTVFGSREKRPPHSQSEFIVFQKLSQWIVRVLQSSPRVPVQSFMDMLVAYENLFLEKCSHCQRFLSAEGYLPPVARVRQEYGSWEPQHGTCVQN